MDRVDELLERYAAAVRSGDADPAPFLTEVEGSDRDRLERRMEIFLMASPVEEDGEPREWDPSAYRGSLAERIVGEIVEETRCPSGEWPELIPDLMAEGELERETVVTELAEGLGAETPEQVEKVRVYFHGMTWGTLDARRVTDTVLDRLAQILDSSRDALRQAGDAIGRSQPDPAGGATFARRPSVEALNLGLEDSGEGGMRSPSVGLDEIDRLFTSREPGADRT
ncbi:MAG: hypothetical protein ACKOB2_00980 [Solirubrobacterales bacterium]